MPDFWNVLHDGSIDSVEGGVPGDVRLSVEVPYLHEIWANGGDHLYIDLLDCTLFEWHVFGKDDQIIVFEDLKTIAQSKPQIRSAATVDSAIHLYIRGNVSSKDGQTHPLWKVQGELRIRYDDMQIYLGNGDPVTLDEVREKAAEYWKKDR